MDPTDLMEPLARRMNEVYDGLSDGSDTMKFMGDVVRLADTDFRDMPDIEPAAVAYVDGADAPIFHSPVFKATLNRTYCSMVRGGRRLIPPANQRIQFVSLERAGAPAGIDGNTFELFHNEGDGAYVPKAADVGSAADMLAGGTNSLPREMAVMYMAAIAARGMADGDVLVVGGAFDSWRGEPRRLLSNAAFEARRRGVITCGVSRIIDMVLDSGRPLIDYLLDLGPDSPWFAPLGGAWGDDRQFGSFMVRMRGSSRLIYRLDVDSGPLHSMDWGGAGRIAASLAANSGEDGSPINMWGAADAPAGSLDSLDSEAAMYGRRLAHMLNTRVKDCSTDRTRE